MVPRPHGIVNYYFARYAFLLGWVAENAASQSPAHAFAQTFHTKVPAREARMDGQLRAEKNFLLLGKCIAGKLAGVRAFVGRFLRVVKIMNPLIPPSRAMRSIAVHLFM